MANKDTTSKWENQRTTLFRARYQTQNISQSANRKRKAIAMGCIEVGEQAFNHILSGTLPKGNAFTLAEIAGINGANQTHMLIPLSHLVPLDHISIHIEMDNERCAVWVYCLVQAHSKISLCSHALSGTQSALLALYDATRCYQSALNISNTRVIYHEGDPTGPWQHPLGVPKFMEDMILQATPTPFENKNIAVLSIDNAQKDEAGRLVHRWLTDLGANIIDYSVLSKKTSVIQEKLKTLATQNPLSMIVTTGGTDLKNKFFLTKILAQYCDIQLPGIMKQCQQHASRISPSADLHQFFAGMAEDTFVLSLPQEPKWIEEIVMNIQDLVEEVILKKGEVLEPVQR